MQYKLRVRVGAVQRRAPSGFRATQGDFNRVHSAPTVLGQRAEVWAGCLLATAGALNMHVRSAHLGSLK